MFTANICSNFQDQRGPSRLQPRHGERMLAAQLQWVRHIVQGHSWGPVSIRRRNPKSRRLWLWALTLTCLQRGCPGDGNNPGYRHQAVDGEEFSHANSGLKASPLDPLIPVSVGAASRVGDFGKGAPDV